MLAGLQQEPNEAMSETVQRHAERTAPQAAGGSLAAKARTAWRQLGELVGSHDHPPAAQRERVDLIQRRVRLIAAIFAVLTLAWIPIDALTVWWPYWGDIMWGRFAAALAFLALAARPKGWLRLPPAFEVTLLISVPLGFFLYTNDVLSISGFHNPLAVSTVYFYLPFVVAAGLSIFPLTALEAALPAALAIGAMTLAVEVWPQFLGGQSGLATIWRIILIAGISALAGMSQLRFLLRLTGEATRDGLTGLLTRRVGEELLDSQFSYAKRNKLPFSLLFVDLDRFKLVNDQFGHKAGDDVLIQVGRTLTEAFRRADIVIRWGGEEFVVGLPGTDAVSAQRAAQRLAELGLGARPDGVAMTASIGIAERETDGVERLRALIELADSRMYQAKQAGRNRVCFKGAPELWLHAAK
ncbi:MAG: GGDEF domain-containing protein [Dongiaceae bacterium]